MPSTYSIDACRPTFLTCDVPETDDYFPVPDPLVIPVAQQLELLSLLQTPRQNEKIVQKAKVHARFSFIENRYGTQSMQPRKTNKQTLSRLANPILGHTSTLNALPPEIRQKRVYTNQVENEIDIRIEKVCRPLVKNKVKSKRTVKLPIQVVSTVSHDLKVKRSNNSGPKSFFLTQLSEIDSKSIHRKNKSTKVADCKVLPNKCVRGPVPRKARKEIVVPQKSLFITKESSTKVSKKPTCQDRAKKTRPSKLPPIKTSKLTKKVSNV
ncbi:hypothetical protein THRCLA_01462 [Thraustotheca clavata]|uniref:Uncharacterized protein n=1 Tax=Thraustotheca clavata TaxID=74557 RepID=A0A1W0A880_9STRA|nr:hypothetical protein THRCLA_01462 [Thraustotheca clavata]